jgi:hypothetical protein
VGQRSVFSGFFCPDGGHWLRVSRQQKALLYLITKSSIDRMDSAIFNGGNG